MENYCVRWKGAWLEEGGGARWVGGVMVEGGGVTGEGAGLSGKGAGLGNINQTG